MSKTTKGLVALLAGALLSSGCQGSATSPAPTPAATPTALVYTGQDLPTKVERLSGTPLYTRSSQMSAVTKLEGAPFLLMAPQNPTDVLLVIETGSSPADLQSRASELQEFSGVKEAIEAPELVKLVKEEGLELKQESGKVVVLRVDKPGAASATPGARP